MINQFHTDSGLLLYDFVYPDIFKGCHPHPVPSLVLPRVIWVIKLTAVNSTTSDDPHEEEVWISVQRSDQRTAYSGFFLGSREECLPSQTSVSSTRVLSSGANFSLKAVKIQAGCAICGDLHRQLTDKVNYIEKTNCLPNLTSHLM